MYVVKYVQLCQILVYAFGAVSVFILGAIWSSYFIEAPDRVIKWLRTLAKKKQNLAMFMLTGLVEIHAINKKKNVRLSVCLHVYIFQNSKMFLEISK